MKNLYKKYVLTGFVLGLCFSVYQPAYAQNNENELTDFSIEFDEGLPQPTEVVEENSNIELNVNQIAVDEELVATSVAPEQELLSSTENTDAETSSGEPEVSSIPYSGTYYDAGSLSSDSLTNNTAPRQVDPRYEPGSSFVVVQKSASAGSFAARITAAQRAIDLGRYSSALELYEGLYSKNPRNTQVLMGLAVAQQKSGFNESAIATYEELLKIAPKNTDAIVNMLGLMKAQYPSVAYRRLKELRQNNPNNAYIAGELGLLVASMGQPSEALRYLGIASSLEPNNASHYYNMAVINDRAGEAKPAIELYQKALELDVTYGAGRTIERDQVYDRLAVLRRL